MIEELNPVLRGWHNYHKAIDPYPRRILNLKLSCTKMSGSTSFTPTGPTATS